MLGGIHSTQCNHCEHEISSTSPLWYLHLILEGLSGENCKINDIAQTRYVGWLASHKAQRRKIMIKKSERTNLTSPSLYLSPGALRSRGVWVD